MSSTNIESYLNKVIKPYPILKINLKNDIKTKPVSTIRGLCPLINLQSDSISIKKSPKEIDTTSRSPDAIHIGEMLYAFKKIGVRCNFTSPEVADKGDNRMILYIDKVKPKDYSLTRECNGMIIDYKTLEVLCRPPPVINTKYNRKFVQENIAQYDLFYAQDGTIVNLYWFQPKKDLDQFNDEPICSEIGSKGWRISTYRGIDMVNVRHDGKTYNEVIRECIPEFDKFITTLDQKRTYTLGLSHPTWHLTHDKPYVWFVSSSMNNVKASSRYDPMDGKDRNFILANEPFTAFGIVEQPAAENPQSYQKLLAKVGPVSFGKCGYILRLRNPGMCAYTSMQQEITENTYIFIRSNYHVALNSLFYDARIHENSKILNINKTIYIMIRAFLDAALHQLILVVLPASKEIFESYDKKISDVTAKIYKETHDAKTNTKFDVADAAQYFRGQISEMHNPSKMSLEQITSFIKSSKYIDVWYRYLHTAT